MSAALVIWGFSSNIIMLLIILAPIALAGGVLNVVLTSELTKSIFKEDVGGTLGLSASLQTFAQIVSPALGGILLDKVGTWSVGAVAGIIMIGATLFIQSQLLKKPEMHGPCGRINETPNVKTV